MKTTLAINGPKKCSTLERILDATPPFFMLFLNVMMVFVVVILLKQEGTDLLALAFTLTVLLFTAYMFLFVLDNHLRLFHSQEMITIQGEELVIDCSHSFLRRHKSIPLTSIRQIKQYNGSRGSHLTVPDTLRVHYGRHSRYRFGINMTYDDSCRLAEEITSHLLKQVRQ